MAARNRSTLFTRVNGTWWYNNNPGEIHGGGIEVIGGANCSDITDAGGCEPFYVETFNHEGGIINKFSSGAFSSQFRDYICSWCQNTSSGGHLSISAEPADIWLATNAAARTNPSAPIIDMPVSIFEFRPTIQHIRDAGDHLSTLIRRIGGRNLEFQFAIRPLIGDINNMLESHRHVARRAKVLNRLYTGHGLRRTVSQGSFSRSAKVNATLQSLGTLCTDTFDVTTTLDCSTHIRWKPTTSVPISSNGFPDAKRIRALAHSAVHGQTIDFSTLWEVMPWSWALDWFGNVGTFLKASRNLIPARVSVVCPMKHAITRGSTPGWDYGGGKTITAIQYIRETKRRSVSFVSPIAHFNFLNGHQVGILASLAAARAR